MMHISHFIYSENQCVVTVAQTKDLYQTCLEIRKKVFIEEQGVASEVEIDPYESESVHFVISKEGIPLGTSRIRKQKHFLKFERIAILSNHRGQGIGKILMRAMVEYAHKNHPDYLSVMHAQAHALPFYEKLGWKKYGDLFTEAAIEHYLMVCNGVLETNRLLLRKLHLGDVDNIQRIVSDPVTMSFYPGTKTKEETISWITNHLHSYHVYGLGFYSCHLKETGEFVGCCGLKYWEDVDGQEEVEIGYLFVREHWKKGYATEAAQGVKIYANEHLGIDRLVSLIRPKNRASRIVAERNGMKVEKEIDFMGGQALVYSNKVDHLTSSPLS